MTPKKKIIKVEIPKGFFNCGVTVCNHFIADTNNSVNWSTLKFPLPKPLGKKWAISSYETLDAKTIVTLVSYPLKSGKPKKTGKGFL